MSSMLNYGSAQQITKKNGAHNDQQHAVSVFGVIMTDSPVRHITKKANRYSDRLRSKSPQPALSSKKVFPPSKTFNVDIKKAVPTAGLDRSTGSSVTKGSAPNPLSGASSQVVTSKSSGVHQPAKTLTQAVSRARSPHISEHLTLTDQTLQITRNSSPQPLASQTGGISPRSQVYVASMVSVLVRVRPANKTESKLVGSGEAFECLSVENESSNIGVKLKIRNKLGEIRHSEVTGFVDEQTDNSQLFLKWIRPCIAKVLDGFNLSVLCYGVTGAGKTHTMFGEKWEEGSRGVVYETAEHLLNLKEQSQGTGMRIHIEVSIFEIYNENIRDLSYPNPISLNCCEDPRGEVYVKDLRKFPVISLEELRLFLQSGNSRRVKASTNKNMHSSRSHAIVEFTISTVSVNSEGKNDGNVKVGRLLLIDLAGSERLDTVSEQSANSYPGSTQPEKNEIARKQEGAKINKSLLSLTNCILQLGTPNPLPGTTKGFTNFRDSKLTRILKTSLGGNSKTIMIGCVCRSSTEYENTLNTLNYCSKAACIKKKEIQVVLKKTEKEIDSILNPPKMEIFPPNPLLKLSENKSPKKRPSSRIFGLGSQRSRNSQAKHSSMIMAKDFSITGTADRQSANFSGFIPESSANVGQGWDPSVFDEVKSLIRKDSCSDTARLIECMRKMIEEKKRLDELYRKQKVTTADYFHAMTTYNELSLRVLRVMENSYPQRQNTSQEQSNTVGVSAANTTLKRGSTPLKSSLSFAQSSQRQQHSLKRYSTKDSYYATQMSHRPNSLGRANSIKRPSSKAFSAKAPYTSADTRWARKIDRLRTKVGKMGSSRGFISKSPETLLSNRNSAAAQDDTLKLSLARQNYRNFKNEMKVVYSLKQSCDRNNPRELFEVGYKIDFLVKSQQENNYLLTKSQEKMMADLKDFKTRGSSRHQRRSSKPTRPEVYSGELSGTPQKQLPSADYLSLPDQAATARTVQGHP